MSKGSSGYFSEGFKRRSLPKSSFESDCRHCGKKILIVRTIFGKAVPCEKDGITIHTCKERELDHLKRKLEMIK